MWRLADRDLAVRHLLPDRRQVVPERDRLVIRALEQVQVVAVAAVVKAALLHRAAALFRARQILRRIVVHTRLLTKARG